MEISPGNPEHLSLANHLRCFDPLNHCPRCRIRSRSLHRAQTTFDMAVIGFHPIIAVPVTCAAGTHGEADLQPEVHVWPPYNSADRSLANTNDGRLSELLNACRKKIFAASRSRRSDK
jgi:hypothetical protein